VLLLSYFLKAAQVGISLVFISILHILLLTFFKKQTNDFLIPYGALLLGVFGFFSDKLDSLRILPLSISVVFLGIFIYFWAKNRSIPLEMTKKFTKKTISEAEEIFLLRSQGWWVAALFVNCSLHVYFAFYASLASWAFYSSIGWYILFFTTLASNIIIGKIVVKS
jgi:hypothetical protein